MFARMKVSAEEPEKSVLIGDKGESEPMFMHRLFEKGILKYSSADKTALIFEDNGEERQTKYQELNQSANQIAYALLDIIKGTAQQPNQDGDWIIAVCMKLSDNLVTTLLAIWKAGAAYLPIDFMFPQQRIEHILNDSKPALVIYDESYPNSNYFSDVKSVTFGELKQKSHQMAIKNIPDELMLTNGDASTKAIVLYTSGSTGVPKGVRIRHHQFINRIYWQLDEYPYAKSEKFCVAKTALTFVDHLTEIWCPLFRGITLVIIPRAVVIDPEQFISILEKYRIERLLCVPTLLRSILMCLNMREDNESKFMLRDLQMWMSSGETLTVQLANKFFNYFDTGRQKLLNFYGCTELSCDVCSYEISSKEQLESLDQVPLGTPFPTTILYILDGDMKLVNEGEVGEIYCAGWMVTDGYVSRSDTGKAFIINPFEKKEPYVRMYKTGDFGCIKDGLLYFEGRHDAQIKIRGHRVDISEVEKIVNELSYVDKSAVLVYHAGQWDQVLIAYIVTKKLADKRTEMNPEQIEIDLKQRLSDYMIPHVHVLEDFPYLTSGKIDRQQLLNMYESTASPENKDVKPLPEIDLEEVPKEKLEMAKKLFEIIGESLGNELRNKVSIKSNFFTLGGNSLNCIYTVTQLRNHGFFISITDFINAEDLGVILSKVSVKEQKSEDMTIAVGMKLVSEPINDLEKDECIHLLAKSFFDKSDLEKYIPDLKLEHYVEVLEGMWDSIAKQGLSFMVKNELGELVGAALNFDLEDHPEIEIKANNPLAVVKEFLEFIETPIIQSKYTASLGDIFQCHMLGTAEKLSTKDNIILTAFMEQEIINLATAKGFKGIFTTNTNQLTQQCGETVFDYETLSEHFPNQFIDHSGNKPFGDVPDTLKAVIMYKSLEKVPK